MGEAELELKAYSRARQVPDLGVTAEVEIGTVRRSATLSRFKPNFCKTLLTYEKSLRGDASAQKGRRELWTCRRKGSVEYLAINTTGYITFSVPGQLLQLLIDKPQTYQTQTCQPNMQPSAVCACMWRGHGRWTRP